MISFSGCVVIFLAECSLLSAFGSAFVLDSSRGNDGSIMRPFAVSSIGAGRHCSCLGVSIRDWDQGEGDQIRSLLSSFTTKGFDPEGPLEIDCGSETLLKESYDAQDGGCMLVATTDDKEKMIVGTAALIAGTPVTYLKSGASVSSPDTITGAVRRVCSASSSNQESILRALLEEIENRATQAGVSELIVLAYPSSDVHRPNGKLLEGMGYSELPVDLVGVRQYSKRFS